MLSRRLSTPISDGLSEMGCCDTWSWSLVSLGLLRLQHKQHTIMKRIARDWSPMTQGAEERSPLSRANHCSPAPTQARWTTMTRPCQHVPPFSVPRIEGRKLWPLSGLCNPPLASHLDRPNTGGEGYPKGLDNFAVSMPRLPR